ncbi:hypothetical protein PMZ80_004797 [Knufia obscura]|uniref:Uncharacterized protein n=2 Tax=Knufia TaxID=430999 RepID=A0ABR0RU59_9EURO|nr:hypothetical protein PMZ80_004797 [Knufia obscura]
MVYTGNTSNVHFNAVQWIGIVMATVLILILAFGVRRLVNRRRKGQAGASPLGRWTTGDGGRIVRGAPTRDPNMTVGLGGIGRGMGRGNEAREMEAGRAARMKNNAMGDGNAPPPTYQEALREPELPALPAPAYQGGVSGVRAATHSS